MAFSLTLEQYNKLLNRITRLEQTTNDVLMALDALVSVQQVHQLLALESQERSALQATVDALEERVEAIESEPIS